MSTGINYGEHEDAAESMEASNHGERTAEMLGWLVIYKEATNSIIILEIQRNSPCNAMNSVSCYTLCTL